MRRAIAPLLIAALGAAACSTEPEPVPFGTHVDDWRDEVIYQVLVDRFDDADPTNDDLVVEGDLARWQGGDWQGVRLRLDYIQRLGATTIWISPIVRNVERTDRQDGYHAFWAADFTEVEPRFGTLDDLRALVDDAHRRDMKVIVDIVTNHAGRLFYYDLDGSGSVDEGEWEPPFSDDIDYASTVRWALPKPRVWLDGETVELSDEHFHRRGVTGEYLDAHQREMGDFFTGLRDLDTEHPEVVAAMIETYARWVELTDIDGFRLDAVPHIAPPFWAAFCSGLRGRLSDMGKHKFLLVGEIFHGDPALPATYTDAGGLDATFDFSLKWDVIDAIVLDGVATTVARGPLESYRAMYRDAPHADGIGLAPWQARVSFMDNHDMSRVRGWLDDDRAVALAATIVFTVDAIPSVYYGTEQHFAGTGNDASREVMWHSEFREDRFMFRHIARLADIRRQSTALRRGNLVVRYTSDVSARESAPGAGVLAYERIAEGDRALVVINGHPLDRGQVSIPSGFAPGTVLRDVLAPEMAEVVVGDDGAVAADVPPRRAWILVARD